jgi:hypothetical protein
MAHFNPTHTLFGSDALNLHPINNLLLPFTFTNETQKEIERLQTIEKKYIKLEIATRLLLDPEKYRLLQLAVNQ